jgi:hypothetical protein
MNRHERLLANIRLRGAPTTGRRLSRASSLQRFAGGAFAFAVVTMVSSCTEPLPTVSQQPGLSRLVTSNVMARVQGNQFALPEHGDSVSAEISGDRAKQLVAAFWHDGARGLEYGVSRDRGAPIHSSELQPCSRAYYVTSAYRHIRSDAPVIIKKALGPHWLVGLCYGDIEEVVIGVSAFATDAKIGNGRFKVEDPGVVNFQVMGVPLGTTIPVTPEQIAQFVTDQTGHLLADVPLLVMRPYPKGAVTAVWQVTLDVPVSAKGNVSGTTRNFKTFFAGHLNGWNAPALAADFPNSILNQSDSEIQEFFWVTPERHTEYAVTRRASITRDLELISIGDR